MEGVSPEECRSIFFDWTLGLPAETDPREAAGYLLELYGAEVDSHPMKTLLREGATMQSRWRGRRRGGIGTRHRSE